MTPAAVRRPGVPMPRPVTAPPPDRAALWAAVRAADLLAPAQLARAEALAPHGTASDFAAALVAHGLLTRFQANRLLAGRTDGFAVDQYVLLDEAGRGPRGRVYKARHRTMNRPVALHVLAGELTRTRAQRAAVLAAVRTAAALAHPHIVTAYDANEVHDRFYLVLEYVDGPNLAALVKRRGPLPVAEACEFARQIASGLAHAHERGVVHGDLKPTNVLVARPTPGAPLVAKVSDFGAPKGPPVANGFAAPEQLDPAARGVDHRADLYALGALLFFLLTGRGPGRGSALARLRPDVPDAVAEVVRALLAPHPAARPATATEALAALAVACPSVAPDAVSFDVPLGPGVPADEGSPWAQITGSFAADTVPCAVGGTPPARPRRAGSVSPVATVALVAGAVLLSLLGVVATVRALSH